MNLADYLQMAANNNKMRDVTRAAEALDAALIEQKKIAPTADREARVQKIISEFIDSFAQPDFNPERWHWEIIRQYDLYDQSID